MDRTGLYEGHCIITYQLLIFGSGHFKIVAKKYLILAIQFYIFTNHKYGQLTQMQH